MTVCSDNSNMLACDAMCGGLARWLRLLGVDTAYVAAIDDADLVALAAAEGRIVVSADGALFHRRPMATGVVKGVRLPVGLSLEDQVRWVVRALRIRPAVPRCTRCNATMAAKTRAEVADRVPARTLIWVREYFMCPGCEQVFWQGTHWRRIQAFIDTLSREMAPPDADAPDECS